MNFLRAAQTFSMGLKSGEYGGRNITLHPAASANAFNTFLRCHEGKRRRKHLYEGSTGANAGTEIVERNDVFKLLFYSLEKVECIIRNAFEALYQLYPCFQSVHNIVWEFKNLLVTKKADELASWLKKAQALKVREINSFVDGVKRDFEAVFNAVKFDYSNGLAEGKVKLIKHIVAGTAVTIIFV